MWKPPTRGDLALTMRLGIDGSPEDLVQGQLSETGLVNFDGSEKKTDESAGHSAIRHNLSV